MDNQQIIILVSVVGAAFLVGYFIYKQSNIGKRAAARARRAANAAGAKKPANEEVLLGESSSIHALGPGTVFDPSILDRCENYKPALLPGY